MGRMNLMKLFPDAVRTLLISVLPSEFIDDCARAKFTGCSFEVRI